MICETLSLLLDLPATPIEKERSIFQEQITTLMSRDGVSLADIQRATGINLKTSWEWIKAETKFPLARPEILELAKYFNVSLEYLLYGIGTDEPYWSKEELI